MESWLINKKGYPIAIFKIEDINLNIKGEIFKVIAWSPDDKNIPYYLNFFAHVYIKWDACSHFTFYGEDLYSENIEYDQISNRKKQEEGIESYYHICGLTNYLEFSAILYFAYLTMTMVTKNEWWKDEDDLDIMKSIFDGLGYSVQIKN
jgi:hypothetical protein